MKNDETLSVDVLKALKNLRSLGLHRIIYLEMVFLSLLVWFADPQNAVFKAIQRTSQHLSDKKQSQLAVRHPQTWNQFGGTNITLFEHAVWKNNDETSIQSRAGVC